MALPRHKTEHTAPRWWLENQSFIERILHALGRKKPAAASGPHPVRKTA